MCSLAEEKEDDFSLIFVLRSIQAKSFHKLTAGNTTGLELTSIPRFSASL